MNLLSSLLSMRRPWLKYFFHACLDHGTFEFFVYGHVEAFNCVCLIVMLHCDVDVTRNNDLHLTLL